MQCYIMLLELAYNLNSTVPTTVQCYSKLTIHTWEFSHISTPKRSPPCSSTAPCPLLSAANIHAEALRAQPGGSLLFCGASTATASPRLLVLRSLMPSCPSPWEKGTSMGPITGSARMSKMAKRPCAFPQVVELQAHHSWVLLVGGCWRCASPGMSHH